MYSKNNQYINIAIKQAKIAFKKNEIAIGAVLVFKEKVIVKGHNYTVKKQPINHAEILVLNKTSKILYPLEIQHSCIYISLEPCEMCAKAINLFKIKNIIFGAYSTKEGGVEHGKQIFKKKSSYKKINIIGGILEKECGQILKNYFYSIRDKNH